MKLRMGVRFKSFVSPAYIKCNPFLYFVLKILNASAMWSWRSVLFWFWAWLAINAGTSNILYSAGGHIYRCEYAPYNRNNTFLHSWFSFYPTLHIFIQVLPSFLILQGGLQVFHWQHQSCGIYCHFLCLKRKSSRRLHYSFEEAIVN